jgi:hypothetical protein
VNASVWANVVMVVALVAPVAAFMTALLVVAEPEEWGRVGCGIAAAAWAVVLVAGQHPHIGRLAPDDIAMAASIGVALLGFRAFGASAAPVSVLTAALAFGQVGSPSTVAPLLGIAAAAALVAIAGYNHPRATAAVATGVVVAAIGVHAGGRGGAALVLVACAVIVVAGTESPRSPLVVVVPVALTEALRVGPAVASSSAGRWVAVAFALAGLLTVAAPAISERAPAFPFVTAIALWTLVAAAGPYAGALDAARPLAAATVLVLMLGGPLALLATLPGAVVLVDAIAGGSGIGRFALAACAFGAFALAGSEIVHEHSPERSGAPRPRPEPLDAVAIALSAWLVLRPTAWSWLRLTGLRAYTQGVALATASGLLAGVALFILGATWQGPVPVRLMLDCGTSPPSAPAQVRRVTAVAAGAMGIVAALLVRSARL